MDEQWRPLSARNSEERAKEFDQLVEGIPQHLVSSLQHWVMSDFLNLNESLEAEAECQLFLREFERRTRHKIYRSHTARATIAGFFAQPFANQELILDMLDFAVANAANTDVVEALKEMLETGGSAWTVDLKEKGLVRRFPGVQQAIDQLGTSAAASHLRRAWTLAFGRHPDPTAAYDAAVRAVECVYAPAVLPKNPKATLGNIIDALKADPSKLQHSWPVLERGGIDATRAILAWLDLLWKNQTCRHGDKDAPKAPTPEQAAAAVHLALFLISCHATGAVQVFPKA